MADRGVRRVLTALRERAARRGRDIFAGLAIVLFAASALVGESSLFEIGKHHPTRVEWKWILFAVGILALVGSSVAERKLLDELDERRRAAVASAEQVRDLQVRLDSYQGAADTMLDRLLEA